MFSQFSRRCILQEGFHLRERHPDKRIHTSNLSKVRIQSRKSQRLNVTLPEITFLQFYRQVYSTLLV